VSPTQTDTQTTLCATRVTIGRIYAPRACNAGLKTEDIIVIIIKTIIINNICKAQIPNQRMY